MIITRDSVGHTESILFGFVVSFKSSLIKAGLLSEVLSIGRKMAKSDGTLGRIRKQLRSVLISEKHGVAVDRVEMDYQELVWSLRS